MDNKGGFTLIELILVTVIIGILAGMVTLTFAGRAEEARIKAAKGDIASYNTAVDLYALDHNDKLPASLDDLANGKYANGLVSEFVFLETVTVLKRKCGATIAVETGEALLGSKEIKVLPSGELFDASWKEFVDLSKTKLSFVDASNLVAMRMYGTREIATFDQEYRKIKGIEVVG